MDVISLFRSLFLHTRCSIKVLIESLFQESDFCLVLSASFFYSVYGCHENINLYNVMQEIAQAAPPQPASTGFNTETAPSPSASLGRKS